MNNNQYDPNGQYQQNNYNQYDPNTQYNQNNGQYQQNYNQYQQPNGNNGGSFMDKLKDFLLNTPVENEPISQQDIESNKMISIVSYIGILFWIPLIAAKNSKFARFHANQGLVFCLACIVLSVASTIVCSILDFIPILGPIFSLIISIAVYVAELSWIIIGIYNCVKGRPNELPLIGKIRIIKTGAVSGGYNNNNYNNNVNNNYNANNNYNTNSYNNQNTFDANAYSNGAPQQNTGFDANAYSNGAPQQNTGFDANAYSNGTPQQNTGFDNSNNGNV